MRQPAHPDYMTTYVLTTPSMEEHRRWVDARVAELKRKRRRRG